MQLRFAIRGFRIEFLQRKCYIMEDCIFCKIVDGEIPSTKVYEDECCYAFLDIAPQAKVHALVIPRAHSTSLEDVKEDEALLGHLMQVCAKVASALGMEKDGYRVVTNIGKHGRQTVFHLHIHVIGGEELTLSMV